MDEDTHMQDTQVTHGSEPSLSPSKPSTEGEGPNAPTEVGVSGGTNTLSTLKRRFAESQSEAPRPNKVRPIILDEKEVIDDQKRQLVEQSNEHSRYLQEEVERVREEQERHLQEEIAELKKHYEERVSQARAQQTRVRPSRSSPEVRLHPIVQTRSPSEQQQAGAGMDIGGTDKSDFLNFLYSNRNPLEQFLQGRVPGKKGRAKKRSAERNKCSERIRIAFRDVFKEVKTDDEFVYHIPALKDAVKDYEAGGNEGPDLNKPAIDMISNGESRWNIQLTQLIYERMVSITRNNEYPNTDANEYKLLIRNKLRRIKTIWKGAQKRVKHDAVDATFESAEERDLRCKTKNEETARNSRQNTRRATRFKICNKTCEAYLKKNLSSQQLKLWDYLKKILEKYGCEGTSSDETDYEREDGMPIYRIKVLAWRRDIDEFLNYIDSRSNDPDVRAAQGSKGVIRKRGGGRQTRRKAVPGLPRSFYNDAWVSLGGVEQEMVLNMNVNEEEFEWMRLGLVGDA